MPKNVGPKWGGSRPRIEARLRAASKRARTRWTPSGAGGIRSRVKHAMSRALRPYDRHITDVLGGVVASVSDATLLVSDDVVTLRDEVGILREEVDTLRGAVLAAESERNAFDSFVTADMDKVSLEAHARRSRFCTYLGDHLAVCRVLAT